MTFDFDRVYDRTGTESAKWNAHPRDVLPMPVADMDFRSPEPIIKALHDRVEHGFFGYGRVQQEFLDVFTSRLKRRYDWEVAPEALAMVPGVVTGFNVAVKAATGPGDSVLVQTPAYPPILHCPENFNLVRDEAPFVQREDGRYEIDWEVFEGAITPATKVFILCNPHNPTGRVFDRDELQRMADICVRHDLLIASDEIHCDLVYPGHPHTPIATLGPEVQARTITFMAPSKTFNLPGLRASVAIIPDEELRAKYQAARGSLVSGVNILGYHAALAAYRDCDDWLAAAIEYMAENRRIVETFLREHLPMLRMSPPEGTYLAWIDCRALPVEKPSTLFLEAGRVAFNDGATFGPGGEKYIRMNFACPRSMLMDGLERMRKAVATVDLETINTAAR